MLALADKELLRVNSSRHFLDIACQSRDGKLRTLHANKRWRPDVFRLEPDFYELA
jgi:hypothetical protein